MQQVLRRVMIAEIEGVGYADIGEDVSLFSPLGLPEGLQSSSVQ